MSLARRKAWADISAPLSSRSLPLDDETHWPAQGIDAMSATRWAHGAATGNATSGKAAERARGHSRTGQLAYQTRTTGHLRRRALYGLGQRAGGQPATSGGALHALDHARYGTNRLGALPPCQHLGGAAHTAHE